MVVFLQRNWFVPTAQGIYIYITSTLSSCPTKGLEKLISRLKKQKQVIA